MLTDNELSRLVFRLKMCLLFLFLKWSNWFIKLFLNIGSNDTIGSIDEMNDLFSVFISPENTLFVSFVRSQIHQLFQIIQSSVVCVTLSSLYKQ